MRYLLCIFLLLTSSHGFAEECKSPDIEVGLRKILDHLPWGYTVITYKSSSPKIQWLGLYWEGPVAGALMAYDCDGKFLSGVKTGGIKTLHFFYGPRTIRPTVVVEEINTGTGYKHIGYVIFTIQNNKIKKVWEHTKYVSVFVSPSEGGYVDSFEVEAAGPPPDDFGDKLRVEGVRKVYPVEKDTTSDFRVEKLPTKYYCWSKDTETYVQCEENKT